MVRRSRGASAEKRAVPSRADHLQITDLDEAGKDIVLHAFGEKGVGRIVAQVPERQDRDRFILQLK